MNILYSNPPTYYSLKQLGFFGIGILVILLAIPEVFAESECDVSYVEPELGFGYQYQLIDPIDHVNPILYL